MRPILIRRILTCALLIGLAAAPARAASLVVELRGITEARGELMVALAAAPAEFPDHASRFAQAAVKTGEARVRFDGLPPGDYAIAAFQDVNSNAVLDKNPLGIPSEPYGFSNDARGWFGPPSWQAARFHLGPEGGSVVIELH